MKIFFLWAWLCLMMPLANSQPTPDIGQETPTLQVFVREGCPHCTDAKTFLHDFATRRPWLQIVFRPVDEDPAAREALTRITRQAGLWPPGVPTFAYQNRVLVGFTDAQVSGPELATLVGESPASNAFAARSAGPSTGSVETGILGTISVTRLGLPAFTLAVGLLDGFNPCAMWVLLFLLSLLVHLHDRRRMLLIAGTFVMVSALLYYAFMAAWLNIFMAVGLSAAVRTGLALLAVLIAAINIKDFFAFKAGISLSIPDSAKPKLYARIRAVVQTRSLALAVTGSAMLAVVVNFIELLCTAGLPAMYTAVLAQQQLSPSAYHGYLGLYILGYIADDSLMVGTAVIALSSRKLTESAGRWLKLVSGLVMLVLGGFMLLRPDWLF